MLARRQRPALTGLSCACLASLLIPAFAFAQLTQHPATLPIPDIDDSDAARAVVIIVQFHSHTEVDPLKVLVANTRARSSIGEPPLIRIDSLDGKGNVIAVQYAWHPLWTREWDDDGRESGSVLTSGPGTFYVPFREGLAAVRISDVRLAQELVTVDVSATVDDFCTAVADSPLCGLFRDGFESGD